MTTIFAKPTLHYLPLSYSYTLPFCKLKYEIETIRNEIKSIINSLKSSFNSENQDIDGFANYELVNDKYDQLRLLQEKLFQTITIYSYFYNVKKNSVFLKSSAILFDSINLTLEEQKIAKENKEIYQKLRSSLDHYDLIDRYNLKYYHKLHKLNNLQEE